MVCFPNAKINLGLYITEKRPDGYHNLETIFLPVPVYDALEIIPSATTESNLKIVGLEVQGAVEQNLVWRAWHCIKTKFPEQVSPVNIYLKKAIPMGAGLGGGSADGSFMLRLLNDYFCLNLSPRELATLALDLGSDCPFFVYNTPQIAYGRGEDLRPLTLDIDWNRYKLGMVFPNVHISTQEAFGKVTPKKADFDLKDINELDIMEWRSYIQNRFEESVFHLYPQLEKIKQYLYHTGAVYASMTGTGSAFYGIFPKDITITAPLYDIKWYEGWVTKN